MSIDIEEGRIVHYPANVVKFEFDNEVASIFPDMAERSIPLYAEVHRLHVSLLMDRLLTRDFVNLIDVGASRGEFFREVCNQLQWPLDKAHPRISMVAVDSSQAMLDLLSAEMPGVHTVHARAEGLETDPGSADVICMMYILQFIEEDKDKLRVLRWAYDSLKPGGMLILGQKDLITDTYGHMFTEEYHRFRMSKGYTMEEIRAKTDALRFSMWPSTPTWLEDMCIQAGFMDYAVTSRWLQFSTSICTKR